MTIRILCIVIAFIVAVWVSRKVNLSGGWTVIFTLLASAAVIAGLGIIVGFIFLLKAKRKSDAEEAEERERILNTDIDEMSDSVLNKYNKEN